MSAQATSAVLFPAWKQEVNRRVAAHMSNRTSSAVGSRPIPDGRAARGSRAAQAAARVAERYAHAPSYNELLADEARNAMRAAEAAQKAAQQAHAAVQYVLDGLEAVATPELGRQHETEPGHSATEAQASASAVAERNSLEDWRTATARSAGDETAEPIYPNLIEFPRPMVATRRVRPRRAEGPLAALMTEPQLSIFEVDPASISTEAAPAVDEPAAPIWMRAEESRVEFAPRLEPDVFEDPAPQTQQRTINAAPLSFRMMALLVDSSLTLTAFLSLAMLTISHVGHLPGLRAAEVSALLGMIAVGAAYQALFLLLAKTTPGMMYAGLALTSFDGGVPNREQCKKRLWSLGLSVAPLGLGLVWVLFDEDGLMGHDRLSRTYLRSR